MAFEEIETGNWKPEKDEDEIVGILLSKESNVGANNSMLYTLEFEGKPMVVWGSTILDPKMLAVKIGDLVKIVYKGLGKPTFGHSAPKIFKVLVDKEEKKK